MAYRKQNEFPALEIGIDRDGKKILLDDSSLVQNGLMIIGAKNSGKSSLIPQFLQQMLVTKEEGSEKKLISLDCCTVITSLLDQSFQLYGLSCKNHRANHTELLSPSTDLKVKDILLSMDEYDYDRIEKNIIDYVAAIAQKHVVIIDMEEDRYGEAARRAVCFLLLQIGVSMYRTSLTAKRRHYLLIDGAERYLPYLELIIKYGKFYNTCPILFFESRSQFADDSLIVNKIRNVLLLGDLYHEDSKYYSESLGIPQSDLLQGRGHATYSFYDKDMIQHIGTCHLSNLLITDHEHELMVANGKRYRSSLRKTGADEIFAMESLKRYAKGIAHNNRIAEAVDTCDVFRTIEERQREDDPCVQNESKISPAVEKMPIIDAESVRTPVIKETEKDQEEDGEKVTFIEGLKTFEVGAPEGTSPHVERPKMARPSAMSSMFSTTETDLSDKNKKEEPVREETHLSENRFGARKKGRENGRMPDLNNSEARPNRLPRFVAKKEEGTITGMETKSERTSDLDQVKGRVKDKNQDRSLKENSKGTRAELQKDLKKEPVRQKARTTPIVEKKPIKTDDKKEEKICVRPSKEDLQENNLQKKRYDRKSVEQYTREEEDDEDLILMMKALEQKKKNTAATVAKDSSLKQKYIKDDMFDAVSSISKLGNKDPRESIAEDKSTFIWKIKDIQ